MANLYNTVGSSKTRNLLADPQGAEKISVPVLPGEGEIKAGTLLYRNGDGYWLPAAAANVVNTNQAAVLAEDIDAGTETSGIAEDAIAYRAGRFIRDAVKLKGNTALAESQIIVLRGQNIVFDRAASDEEFDNETAASTGGSGSGD